MIVHVLVALALFALIVYLKGVNNERYWKKRGVVFHTRNRLLGVAWDYLTKDRAFFQHFDDVYKRYSDAPAVGIGTVFKPALFLRDVCNNKMGFKRNWDSTCPKIWKEFERGGRRYIVQDLAPEDDERAMEILVDHLCTDEVLCNLSNLADDPESVDGIKKFWVECLKQRASLGCYTMIDGKHTLVALNVCVVDTVQERTPDVEITGAAWKNVYAAIELLEERCDVFKYLGIDTILHALGLVVAKDFRGIGLGSYILDSREPLCKVLGIKATATVFTGPASQKSAAKVGFTTIHSMSLKDYVDAGLNYPSDETRLVKLMVKQYSH